MDYAYLHAKFCLGLITDPIPKKLRIVPFEIADVGDERLVLLFWPLLHIS